MKQQIAGRLKGEGSLRVTDLDFASHHIVVRDGTGQQDRVTRLPQHVQATLQQPLQDVQRLHTQDREAGGGGVYLPYALERKYPKAHDAWVWPDVFPAARLARDPRTGRVRRHHMHKLVLPLAVHAAVRKANLPKPARCHTLRNAST